MRLVTAIVLLVAAMLPVSDAAYSQARGPSRAKTRAKGQHITGGPAVREEERQQTLEEAELDRIALLDPAERAGRFERLQAVLGRFPGRHRIKGRITLHLGYNEQHREITGVADCSMVGSGTGVNCILNATWPLVDLPGQGRNSSMPTYSERLRTMLPAVLVIGLNVDPPGLRAMMVTADSLAFNWTGFLDGEGVTLTRPTRCWEDIRCYRSLQIVPAASGNVTSLVLKPTMLYTLSLDLHPEAGATPRAPLKPLIIR